MLGELKQDRSAALNHRIRIRLPNPPMRDAHVAPVGPTQLLQPLHERGDAGLASRIVRRQRAQEEANAPHPARAAARAAAAASPPLRCREA
jgi:hypothetical protein